MGLLTKSNARPKLTDGFASPERARLGIAVAEMKTAEQQLLRLEAAIKELKDREQNAMETKWEAERALEQAKQDGPRHLAAKLMGAVPEGEPPSMTVTEAQAALAAATADVREAEETLKFLHPEFERAKDAPDYARRRALAAARAVIHSERAAFATAHAARVLRLWKELESETALLLWQAENGQFPVHDSGSLNGLPQDNEIRKAVMGSPIIPPRPVHAASCAPWRDALAALMNDAHAPLPGGA